MKKKLFLVFLLILINLTLIENAAAENPASIPTLTITPSITPTFDEVKEALLEEERLKLFEEINGFRKEKGRDGLIIDRDLTNAAQRQAEYLSDLGELSTVGPDRESLKTRVSATGYGGEKSFKVIENQARTWMATTYPYLVNTVWGEDNAPRINLLNSQMKEIGIGIATGSDKRRYVSVIFGTVQESDNSSIQGTDEFVVGAEEETPSAVPLVTSTLYDDGGQYHVVGAGQTFSEIALAYGLSWYDLANLNGININTPIVVIEGDVLLIHLTSTATLTPTASRTPRPPTITPRPTYTEDRVEMIVQTLSAPDEPADPGPVSKLLARLNRFQKVGGILLVVISLIGLLILFFEPVKRK